MKEQKASFTAEVMVIYRAMELMLPPAQRVCFDHLALHFLNFYFRIIATSGLLTKVFYWFFIERRGFVGARGHIVTRTRFIDDFLKECIDDGITQLVILGAGIDTRAYRFDELKDKVKIFEVDHPASQKKKKERVKKVFGSLPEHVVYVAVDFLKENLRKKLTGNGYNTDEKTLFIWEGVTYYLTREAVDETLSFIANNSGAGSSIIFDYILSSVVDGTCDLEGAGLCADYFRSIGEPWFFGIEDNKVDEWLFNRGFCEVTNIKGKDAENSYFKSIGRDTKVWEWIRFVHAKVIPRQP